MGSRREQDGVESAPTIAAGSVGQQDTIASVDVVGQTAASAPGGSNASANDATLATFDRGLPFLTPSRLVVVQADLYERLGELARGGLGKISRARDLRSGRLVAIKEVIAATEDAAVRFAREAMITANLEHPAIVPVYEVGRWPTGEPFYAMKLVRGRPLDAVIAAATSVDERLALVSHVLTVADALAYAHGERVIHRDLKPQNVLCGAHGETVVIDWGLARRLDEQDATTSVHRRVSAEPGQTYVGAIMGTPAYMPPEQARGKRVDERADVYAIGAMLYHVLAGGPAYRGNTLDELIEKVKAGPPRRLATVVPEVPPDLAAIVERAMAPDPAARYPSAAELATDLRRFTTGQLVRAHRYTAWQRVRRFVGRHRVEVTVATVALAAVAISVTLGLIGVVRARDRAEEAQARAEVERRRADSERDEARRRLIAAHVDRARVELGAQHPREALAFVTAAAELTGLDASLDFLAARALQGIPPAHRMVVGALSELAPIPGSHDVLVSEASTQIRWNPVTDQRVWELTVPLASAAPVDAKRVVFPRGKSLILVDATTGKETGHIDAHADLYNGLAVDLSGRWCAVQLAGRIGFELFDLQTGADVGAIPVPNPTRLPVISPDGQHLATSLPVTDLQTKLVILDRAGRTVAELCGNCHVLHDFGATIAIAESSAGIPSRVRIYDWSGKVVATFTPASVAEVSDVKKSADGRFVAILTSDGLVEVHDFLKGLRWRQTVQDRAYEAAFDAKGRLWVLGSYTGTHLYDAETGVELGRWAVGGHAIRVSDDGDQVVIASLQTGITSWTVRATATEAVAPSAARVRRMVFFDATRTLVASDDGAVSVYERGKPVRELGRQAARITTLERTPEGAVMSSSKDGSTVIRDLDGRELERYAAPRADLSPDGTHLVIGNVDGAVAIVDRKTRTSRSLGKLAAEIAAVRWSPDGTMVAAIDNDARTIVWRVDGTQLIDVPQEQYGLDVAFSHDGRWLVRMCSTLQVVMISLVPGVPDRPLDLAPHVASLVASATFSNDDARVAIADTGRVRVWDPATGKLVARIEPGTDEYALVFSADGKLLYGGGGDHVVRVWEMPTGVVQAELPVISDVYGLQRDDVHDRLGILTLGPAVLWNLRDSASASANLAALRRTVDCLLDVDPVTGASHVIDVAACNRLATP